MFWVNLARKATRGGLMTPGMKWTKQYFSFEILHEKDSVGGINV